MSNEAIATAAGASKPATLSLVPSSAVRASDAEREHTARILRAAAGEGMLTLAEADERLGQVYAATYRHELEPITKDLPDGGRRLLENTPEAKAAARTGLIRHGVTVGVVAAVLITIWAFSGAYFFWPAWPLLFMTLSVVGHARRIGYGPAERRGDRRRRSR